MDVDSTNVYAFLKQCTDDDGVYINRPSDPSLLEGLPNQLIEFFKFSNGVQINNAYIDNIEDLLANDREKKDELADYLILGNQGNMEWYLFDKKKKLYFVSDFQDTEPSDEVHESFKDLLVEIIESELDEEDY